MAFLMKKISAVTVSALLMMLAFFAHAEDIDVFVAGSAGSGGQPNILIVLDNTSNWSRQNQKWPDKVTQGQSEVRAISKSLEGLVGKVNVGLMEFTTQGNANQNGGFVRFALQPLTEDSKAVFDNKLNKDIFENIESPQEKRNSGEEYGNLMYDVYNYLAGNAATFNGEGTPIEYAGKNGSKVILADANAYQNASLSSPTASAPLRFRSPLTAKDACVKTYLIFIGNPSSSGPSSDDETNSAALNKLYLQAREELGIADIAPDKLAGPGSGNPLPIPQFSTVITGSLVDKGWTVGQCYASPEACTSDQEKPGKLCNGLQNCACSTAKADIRRGSCSANSKLDEYKVLVDERVTEVRPSGGYDTSKGQSWNLDDWAKFLNLYGVPYRVSVTETVDGETQTREVDSRMPVVTYTIDVFNAQQNSDHTGLLLSTANVGGGKYFAARNEKEIVVAIQKAASEILSASSTFAAVALPLSATNRAQNENQVFIGMFRPDKDADPRWFGNLKRYQIGLVNGKAELVDVDREPAINPLTNFPSECAQSFWTTDSGSYWENKNVAPPPQSKCITEGVSSWSDAPDGPFVEKGGAAQMLRNYPSAAAADISKRKVLTVGANGLSAFDSSFAGKVTGGQSVIDYIRGHAQEDLKDGTYKTLSEARHTIHGDVVHSRPLPINYGGAPAKIRVFYGANDGLLRAIDAATGKESWSFVAPEHFDKLQRLQKNTPKVAFPNQSEADKPEPKGYFFDGAIGSHLEYGQSNRVTKAYIFPTMRRGGRMVYAFDVTDPEDPELLWSKGCSSNDSDAGCDAGFSGIGQTWSLPRATYLKGYENGTKPVVIFGGGYDSCEDADAITTPCTGSAKGRVIYVLDAETGDLIAALPTQAELPGDVASSASVTTAGSVAADITLVDVDYDGLTDYAYAVDLSGNVWRVNFIDEEGAISSGDWEAALIAYTRGGARKFLNGPSVLPYEGKVFLAFGSGNRERPLTENYPYKLNVDDRYYVFLDDPSDALAPYDLDDEEVMYNFTSKTSCDTQGLLSNANRRGWFMSLPGQGEQVVTTSVIAGGVVAFNTYRPGGSKPGMCSRPMGVSTSYQVNLFNASGAVGVDGYCGGERSVEVGTGMPISPATGTVSVPNPSCTGDNCDEVVTFCIGCEGLSPLEIVPRVDQTRTRTYWNSDIDR